MEDYSNFLNKVEIKNFKSIKHLDFDCKRVNVFIGKPNVGKSNIIEAINVLGVHYCYDEEKIFREFIRYEEFSNLFYDDDLTNLIEINTDKMNGAIRHHTNNINSSDVIVGNKNYIDRILQMDSSINDIYNLYDQILNQAKNTITVGGGYNVLPFYTSVSPEGRRRANTNTNNGIVTNPIKRYQFKINKDISNKFPAFLLPPYGPNLFSIVDRNPELRKEITEIFSDYGLNFVAYKKENKFEIEKNIDGYITKYHYSSMADTFQRLIFYYAAIDSNYDSVLLLEEPEVHSFPQYTKDLSQRIIDSDGNQFFITTHSPYMLQNLISSLSPDELNVFVTYFEDYQTKVIRLNDDDLRKASEFSVDLFYNLDEFIK